MRDFLMGLGILALTGSAVIALLLAISPAAGRRFQPKWRYWAWLIVALRLAVPLHFSLYRAPVALPVPDEAQFVVERYREPTQNTMQFTLDHPTLDHVSPGPAAERPVVSVPEVGGDGSPAPLWRLDIPVEGLVLAVWLAGAVIFLAWHIGSYLRFKHKVLRWSAPDGEADGVKVFSCPLLDSPVLMGLFRPVIALPEGLSEGERGFALLHECTHHRRRDLWFKLLTLWVNALYWFSPFMWLLRRQAARDVEIACDADVLRNSDGEERRAYGGALLRTVRATAAPCAALTSQFSGGSKGLKERFRALLDTAPKRPGTLALAAVCVLTAAGGVLVGCEAPEQPAEPTTTPAITADGVDRYVSTGSKVDITFYVDETEGHIFLTRPAGRLAVRILLNGEEIQNFKVDSVDGDRFFADGISVGMPDLNGDGCADFGFRRDTEGNWNYYIWSEDERLFLPMANVWGCLTYDPLTDRLYGELGGEDCTAYTTLQCLSPTRLLPLAQAKVTRNGDGTLLFEDDTYGPMVVEESALDDLLFSYRPWPVKENVTYAAISYTRPHTSDLTQLAFRILGGDGGEPGEEVVWPCAPEVALGSGKTAVRGSRLWQQDMFNYVNWPLLQSSFPAGPDVMEIECNADGEIIRLQWRQLPKSPYEDSHVHPIPNS